MKKVKYVVILLSLIACFSACKSPKTRAELKIQKLEKTIFNDTVGTLDKSIVHELIESYLTYAEKYPSDSNTVVYLFKAASYSMSIMASQQAIDLYQRVEKEYPTYSKAPECLFLQGFIYENHLRNVVKARDIYTEFILKYPQSEFVDDAQASINNLGKTPEQIIKEFEAQQKESK